MQPKRKKYIYISDFSCSPACIFSMEARAAARRYSEEEEEGAIILLYKLTSISFTEILLKDKKWLQFRVIHLIEFI